ncbi:hypothetical protein OSTOST_04498 [Ostertagia ostertagi]
MSAYQPLEQSMLLNWKRHNNLQKSQRVLAYVLRFLKRLLTHVNSSLKKKVESSIPEIRHAESLVYITATEMEMALRILIRNHQKVHLPTERQTALKQLKLKEDQYGILRCRGRLGNSELKSSAKHPYLIASKTDLARLIVENAHSSLHCSMAHTMANRKECSLLPTERILQEQDEYNDITDISKMKRKIHQLDDSYRKRSQPQQWKKIKMINATIIFLGRGV